MVDESCDVNDYTVEKILDARVTWFPCPRVLKVMPTWGVLFSAALGKLHKPRLQFTGDG